jgi:hypothetical protein
MKINRLKVVSKAGITDDFAHLLNASPALLFSMGAICRQACAGVSLSASAQAKSQARQILAAYRRAHGETGA